VLGQNPLDGGEYRGLNDSIRLHLEEPDAGSASNYKLAAANDKGVHPEESKHLIEEDVSGLVVPDNFSHEGELFSRGRSSNGHHPEDSDQPGQAPDDEEGQGDNRLDEDGQVSLGESNSGLENSDSKSEGLEAATEHA